VNHTKYLYAVELDITNEAVAQGKRLDKNHEYWVIHCEDDDSGRTALCVYDTFKEASESAKGRDHKSRVVKFVRTEQEPKLPRLKATNPQLAGVIEAVPRGVAVVKGKVGVSAHQFYEVRWDNGSVTHERGNSIHTIPGSMDCGSKAERLESRKQFHPELYSVLQALAALLEPVLGACDQADKDYFIRLRLG
jgi:hypothetical protein